MKVRFRPKRPFLAVAVLSLVVGWVIHHHDHHHASDDHHHHHGAVDHTHEDPAAHGDHDHHGTGLLDHSHHTPDQWERGDAFIVSARLPLPSRSHTYQSAWSPDDVDCPPRLLAGYHDGLPPPAQRHLVTSVVLTI